MLKKNTTPEDESLEAAIKSIYEELETMTADSAEYARTVDQLVKLYSLKSKKDKGVSKDAMATIAANLAGIILILSFEKTGVIATKALGFVKKVF